MLIVPLQPVPNQIVTATLGNQVTTLHVYQLSTGLFIDVFVNNVQIIAGVICQNLNRIIRSIYLGFIGDLAFIDNMGDEDPIYTGLGARFSLAYIEAADLLPGEG